MKIEIHPHAQARMIERGVIKNEIIDTVRGGESIPAKLGRSGFRRNFHFGAKWRGRYYGNKQVVAYAVRKRQSWLVITVITKFY